MARSVEARHVAFFGKGDPESDYSWLRGREAIPEQLLAVCKALTQVTAEAATATVVVAPLAGSVYLLRAFGFGMDSAYRPVYGLEVAILHTDETLAPEDWLLLAYEAVRSQTLDELDAAKGQQVLHLGEAKHQRSEVDAETLARFRLGIPFQTDQLAALELLRRFADGFQGVALAAKRSQAGNVRWVPALQPYLAVHFEVPEPTAQERQTLEAVVRRPPSAAEWEALGRVEPERARTAVVWAAAVVEEDAAHSAACPVEGAEDPLLEWLIVFRRETLQGASRLAAVRGDLRLEALSPGLLEALCPELSSESREILEREKWPGTAEPATATLEELSRAGYLDGRHPPLTLWAHRLAESPMLAASALKILAAAGVSAAAARMALNLEAQVPPTETEIASAARLALSFRLPVPWDALLQELEERGAEGLSGLAVWAGVVGGASSSLLDLLQREMPPPPGEMVPELLVRALRAGAGLPEPVDVPALTVKLVKARRWEEVGSLLAAMDRGQLPAIAPLARDLILAHLGRGKPVEGVTAAELAPLVEAGLAQPDVIVPPAQRLDFIAIAELWPETAALGALIRGKATIPGPCPASWLCAVKRLFQPELASQWLERLSSDERSAAGSWLVATLGLPPVLGALAAEPDAAAQVDCEQIQGCWPWLIALLALDGQEPALRRLAALARSGALEGNDELAAGLLKRVLPHAPPALASLLVHLLSGVGPPPRISALNPAHLGILLPAIDPLALVHALFLGDQPEWVCDEELASKVARRVAEVGLPCPDRRYTREQRLGRPILSRQLGQIPGWEIVALDSKMRVQTLCRWIRQLGATRDELEEAVSICTTKGEEHG